jgi:hypothetical protein
MMPCIHLRQLYELCDENKLHFSSSDLVRIICKQCEKEEVCPAVLIDDYETLQSRHEETSEESSPNTTDAH